MCGQQRDQPIHPSSMARSLAHSSLDSLEAVGGTCDQRRLWSDCADTQADLSFRWLHKSYCRFFVRWFINVRLTPKTMIKTIQIHRLIHSSLFADNIYPNYSDSLTRLCRVDSSTIILWTGPISAASDLGVPCLPMSLLWDTRLKMGYTITLFLPKVWPPPFNKPILVIYLK